MDGPGEHYAKWNKPGRERQMLYDFTHLWNLTNWTCTHKQSRDRLIDGEQMTASGGRLEGEEVEQKGKKIHRHGQQCGDCWGGRRFKDTKW